MSLQDDIAQYGGAWNRFGIDSDLSAAIAAGLERDYYLVKLADLPEVTTNQYGSPTAGAITVSQTGHADTLMEVALERLALALHAESRESEAVARQARRDELVHQYGYDLTYDDQSPMVKDLINRLISANADHTVAGEAEIARLKGEGR